MEIFSSVVIFLVVLMYPALRKAYLGKHGSASFAKKSKNRLDFFDFVKGIAILSVILIHAVYFFTEKYLDFDPYWLNIINNIFRFAVGFFFISSGALLTSGLTKKKILRVFVPYIIVCLLIGAFENKSWNLIIGGIIRGDLLPPFYFIPILFQLYLLFPLLKKWSGSKYFLPLSLLVSYIFYPVPGLRYVLGIPTFGAFLYLFTFGITYSKKLRGKKTIPDISFWFIPIILYIALLFLFPSYYYNVRFFYAPALFVVFHYLWNKFQALKNLRVIIALGQVSLWIYLLHFPIESFFFNLINFDFSYSVYVYILEIATITTIVSGVLSKVIKKIYESLSNLTKVSLNQRLFYIALFFLALLIRFPVFATKIHDLDESWYYTIAQVLKNGGVMYVDVVDVKTPLLYYTYTWILEIVNSMHFVHLITIVWIWFTAIVIEKLISLFDKASGKWGAVTYVIFSTLYFPSSLATNSEILLNLPLSLSAYFFVRGFLTGKKKSRYLIFTSGVLCAFATLYKQTALMNFLGFVLFTLILLKRRQIAFKEVLTYICGFLSIHFLAIAFFALKGALNEYIFWTISLNFFWERIPRRTLLLLLRE